MPRTKTAKEKSTPRMAADSMSPGRKINKNNSWRKHGGVSEIIAARQGYKLKDLSDKGICTVNDKVVKDTYWCEKFERDLDKDFFDAILNY